MSAQWYALTQRISSRNARWKAVIDKDSVQWRHLRSQRQSEKKQCLELRVS